MFGFGRHKAAHANPGDRMTDGTVFAGISPDTHKPMYTTSADAKLTYAFDQAQKYAARLDAHGHDDWRVPTKGELNVLFHNRAAIGGFDETGMAPRGWYWSSTESHNNYGCAQRFSGYGRQVSSDKDDGASLRLVR
jgi:hypothetical protein